MFRRGTHAAALVLAACAAANAGIIAFSVNGGAVQFVPVAGAFNTGGNTNCGIAGNCNEVSAFNVVDATGLTFNGSITFTTNDVAGFSTSALEQVTMTVDNPNAAGVINLVVAFVSDQFDPSVGGPAGVGIFGTFPSDNNGAFVSADAQGEMDFSNGGFGGVPGFGSFALRTPLVGGINCLPGRLSGPSLPLPTALPGSTTWWASRASMWRRTARCRSRYRLRTTTPPSSRPKLRNQYPTSCLAVVWWPSGCCFASACGRGRHPPGNPGSLEERIARLTAPGRVPGARCTIMLPEPA